MGRGVSDLHFLHIPYILGYSLYRFILVTLEINPNMLDSEKLNQLAELLPGMQSIIVAIGPTATFDQAAAALALSEALKQSGKEVHLLSSEPDIAQQFPTLLKAESIEQGMGNRNLLVSFDYSPDKVDKVSYHIDEQQQKFCLVIKPQKGQKPLDPASIEYSYTGAEADVIFLIGVHELESLGNLYYGYEQLYRDTTIVTFHTFEPEIGTLKLDASGSSSFSESMVGLLQSLGLPLDADVATNLVSAIEASTNHFQSLNATATTFQTVGDLLQLGARRINRQPAKPPEPRAALGAPVPQNKNAQNPNRKNKAPKKPDTLGGLKYQPSNLNTSGRN